MRRIALLSFAVLLLPLAARADENKLLAYWVQLGPGGTAEARAVMSGSECPTLSTDQTHVAMSARAAADGNFALVCGAPVPAGTKTLDLLATGDLQGEIVADFIPHKPSDPAAAVGGYFLPLPVARPERILVLGDTGCRIKDTLVQPCNDPVAWPFASLAAAAARLKPDLVIHVGDYLYRESPCPAGNTGCAGTPWGNNWATWKADFFDPAAPLLAAAPWVIVRGNHEDCYRSGPGFLRLLGPVAYDPNAPCTDHLASYDIPLDALNLVVMDTANAQDTSIDPSVTPVYQSEFAALANEKSPSWLLMHRPIWGALSGPLGLPVGGNQTMIAALGGQSIPKPVDLMLAGHIHVFEALNYNGMEPPAMLSGNGGDLLDTVPANLKPTVFGTSIRVKEGLSVPGFGFFLMTKVREAWNVDLYDATGTFTRRCIFASGHIDCPK